MDEQALEARGAAALGARRKMLKSFARRWASTTPPQPPSTGPTTVTPALNLGSSGSGVSSAT